MFKVNNRETGMTTMTFSLLLPIIKFHTFLSCLPLTLSLYLFVGLMETNNDKNHLLLSTNSPCGTNINEGLEAGRK